MKTIVNSWNEWDPLKHVILGRADGCCIPPSEPAVDGKVPEDSDMRGQFGIRPKETIDRANELLENFANILKKRKQAIYPLFPLLLVIEVCLIQVGTVHLRLH